VRGMAHILQSESTMTRSSEAEVAGRPVKTQHCSDFRQAVLMQVRAACSLSAELARLMSDASEREKDVRQLQLEAAGLREEASSSDQRAKTAATR
jgi:hypothetical protein